MTTDSGIDLVAYASTTAIPHTIQVKTNLKPKPGGGKGKPKSTGSESNCFEESNATPARWAPVEQRDLAVGESSRVEVEKRLAILDALLASHAVVAGAAHTMAMGDIPLACSIDRWFKLPIARESHPYVERWYQALSGRAGAQQVVGLALA